MAALDNVLVLCKDYDLWLFYCKQQPPKFLSGGQPGLQGGCVLASHSTILQLTRLSSPAQFIFQSLPWKYDLPPGSIPTSLTLIQPSYLNLQLSSVQFSCSVVFDSLWPHESQHARPPCPSPTPWVLQTHVHRVSDAIQPSHPLSSPSPPAPNPSRHQGLFQWVNSSHEVAKVLEFQL